MNDTTSDISGKLIGAAIRVHEELGPGFLESFYEEALCSELSAIHLRFQRQVLVPVRYRGTIIGEHRLDLLVENELVVELKTVESFDSIHYATLRSYLKANKLLARFAPELRCDNTPDKAGRS